MKRPGFHSLDVLGYGKLEIIGNEAEVEANEDQIDRALADGLQDLSD